MPKVTAAYLEARRQEILEAALTLFAEKGFAHTSMADIAAASGISIGAVYRYFPSKGDLVLAVCSEGEGERIPGDTATEAAEQLRRHVDPQHNGRTHARLVAQIWGNAAIDPLLASVVARQHTRIRDQLADLITQKQSGDSEHRTPSDEAEVVLAALIGYAALVAVDAHVDHDGFGRALSRLLD
ncbi:TetR/AcrR family transcriptional regulator [Streptomyces sp. NBC_01373]|uniref:TetR/AcrR family transcriptional regulator n=1 Tax=Streptomyces sp. NBC_01373 TaxID=2903843 RepID=UPI0022537CEC|nr:TetR/AcrR family transcriptional regulator [Streptomyces sp. NBC_01373]MCX4705500.1 TetR/AcrR family transcriptional regulator [Streptomyces sp. NBC_01373]